MSDTTLTAPAETADALEHDFTDDQLTIDPAAGHAAAVTTASGHVLDFGGAHRGGPNTADGIGGHYDAEREDIAQQARQTTAFAQLQRCFPRWRKMPDSLRLGTLKRLARNEPVNPSNPDIWWAGRDAAAGAVLRRHGHTQLTSTRLTLAALAALIEGQTAADLEAGIDWSAPPTVADGLDELLRRAHAKLPIDLDDPTVWEYREDRRRPAARRLGMPETRADDLSRFALSNLEDFEPDDLRSWRIASPTWLKLADDQLGAAGDVERPVGVFIVPSRHDTGWQLVPCLSLEMIRLVAALGGHIDRGLGRCTLPAEAIPELVERMNTNVLHHGEKNLIDSRKQLTENVNKELGVVLPGVSLQDRRDRWGRLRIRREKYKAEDQTTVDRLVLSVLTFNVREFKQRLIGAVDSRGHATASAVMDLGEAVNSAVERGLPILLSTEAAGYLNGHVRVGRMKGKPGMLTITRSDGLSAGTRRVVAEQAVAELRALRREGAEVTVDAGARQVLRMTLAKPLEDDPILLGRQRELAALMAVGSGVNASQVGTGKSVMTARGAFYHRAATTPRFRAMLAADGRLLSQWHEELVLGAPARGMPPLAPNCQVRILDETRQIAGQLRQFDREAGDRALVVLVGDGLVDRFPADLASIRWHLIVADEALRYANPAAEAHRALKQVRMEAAADCWLLTATPRSKHSDALDVLVGLAVGDEAMIADRLNTREAGDLMDEVNAHRLRVNFGPHLVRVTRNDMKAWMPDVRPATPLAIEADSALAELLEAIRTGGREAYRRLLAVIKELRRIDKAVDPELYRQALAKFSSAQSIVLSNVNVYVDASVDPETLNHSAAALAQALVRQGLVDAAIRGGGDGLPLLRGIVAQTLAAVAGEEQVIVFAERVWCLRQLAATLRDRYGVEAHCADGSIGTGEFEVLKRRFVAGQFPVLCLSKVGQQGHNLQNASVICHYDLPWTPVPLEQRVGRAARPGSKTRYVESYIPYIKRAGIEHVVSVITPRGAEQHQILDSFEGVKASESTIANQLGQITADVADSKDEAGYAGTAARLRVAASVFGF